MPLLSITGHFDGSHVLLDENVVLQQNARVIVTVLDDSDKDRQDFLHLAASGLALAYGPEEVEYSVDDIKR